MMEGIEILDKTEILHTSEETAFFFALSMVFAIATIATFLVSFYIDSIKLAIVSALIFALSIITMIILANFIDEPTGKYQYQVTIDENVSMVEFHEKYEIVDIKGKIYTIKEK